MRKILLTLCFSCLAFASDEAWTELANNRFQTARALYEQEMVLAEHPTLAKIGWFLTFTPQGPGDELTRAAMTILEKDPQDPACEFVMVWMKSQRDQNPQWDMEAGQLLSTVQPTSPELRIHYSNHLRHIASRQGNRDMFQQALEQSSYLTQWRFASRFGANPIPDYDRSWPAEKAAYWSDEPISSFRSGVVIPEGRAAGTGIVYAFSAFQLDQPATTLFRVFSYQNITIYVDGKQLLNMPHLELETGRVKAFTASLPAGLHEVMVKVTQTRGQNGQFSLNLEADGLSFPEPGYPQLDVSNQKLPAKPTTYGLKAFVDQSSTELARFVDGYLAAGERDFQRSLARFDELSQIWPNSQIIGGALSELLIGGLRFLPQEESLGRAYQTLSQLCAVDDRTTENTVRLGRLLLKAGYSQEALAPIQAALQMSPLNCEAIETLLDISIAEGLVDIREQALAKLESLGDEHMWALQLRLANAVAEGNVVDRRHLLEKLAALAPWDRYGADLLEMNEDYAGAIADLESRWELYPEKDDYPYNIASNYARLGDRTQQRHWLEVTLDRNPSHRAALLDLINLDCYQGNMDAARTKILDYLEIEPADADFRQMLSHLDGSTAFESLRIKTQDVIDAAKNAPMSKNADSELLLDQLMVRLFPDGSQMRYTHLVTRVLTKDGVDSESEISLGNDLEVLELRTIKNEGTVFYPADIENKSTISLSGIGVGDFIDEEHIEYLPPAYYDRDGLDGSMSFVFQGVDRIYHHSELVLVYPSDLEPKPDIYSRNFPNPVDIHEEQGMTIVRWLTKDMPPVAPEPSMPNPGTFLPRATFTYNTNWEEIRDFFINAVRLRMVMTDTLQTQLEQWQEQESDPRALAELIYREVVDAVEPENQFYQNINLVWSTKHGNASLLLAKLYEEAGLDATMVLARPRGLLDVAFDIPLPDLFTYALIRLNLDGETIWVDPNRKHLPFGYIPFDYRGANGLWLKQDHDKVLVDIPSADDETERIEFQYDIEIDDEGVAHAKGEEIFFGSLASQLSEHFATLNRPEIRQRVEVGVNANFPGAKVSEAKVDEDRPIGEFAIESSFTHRDLIQRNQNWIIENLIPRNSIQGKYASLPSRNLPVKIDQPHINVGKVILHLPDGWRWQNEPRWVTKETEFGSFALNVNVVDSQTLELTRRYALPAQTISPDSYHAFLEFCEFMTENEEVRLEAAPKE
ncbi:MAG: hypothetical protein KDC35_07985 [Acidobacteria bacterium]|nr:hypothetical protein [Acidobacteriota bacterium]